MISKHAGTKHIKIADTPTFFNEFKSKDNPERVNISTSAICLRTADIFNKSSLIILKTEGPNKTPNIKYQIIFGILIFSNPIPPITPKKKIRPKLKNIEFPPLIYKKS